MLYPCQKWTQISGISRLGSLSLQWGLNFLSHHFMWWLMGYGTGGKRSVFYVVTSTDSWVKNFLNDKYGKVNNVFSRPSSRARLSTKCSIGIFLPNPHTRSIYPHFTNGKIELLRDEGVELIRGEWYVSKGSVTSALVMVAVEWKGNVLNHIKWSGSQSVSALKSTGLAVTAQGKTEIKPKSLVNFQTVAVHWWLASVGSNKLKIESEGKIS